VLQDSLQLFSNHRWCLHLRHLVTVKGSGSPCHMQNPVSSEVPGCAGKIWCRSCYYRTILKMLIFFESYHTYSRSEICILICLDTNVELYTVYSWFTERTGVYTFYAENTQNICYWSNLAIFVFDSKPLRSLLILFWIRIYRIFCSLHLNLYAVLYVSDFMRALCFPYILLTVSNE